MKTERGIKFVRFSPMNNIDLLSDLVQCYRKVFGGAPWNEWKKCTECHRKWGMTDITILESMRFMCCGKKVVDFWSIKVVRDDIMHEITMDASCWLALNDHDQVIGFCWGYPIYPYNLEIKLELPGLAKAIEKKFGIIKAVAYQDELGVLEQYRNQKVAKELFRRRLIDFQRKGLHVGLIRTKTIPPTVTYLWFTQKLGYKIVASYNDADGRLVLGRSLHDLSL